jgi:hypothetical protein
MSSLFDAVGDICRTQYNLGAKPKKAADTLKEYEYDDIGLGWCLHCGYEIADWDEGQPVIQIHKLELNTGNHIYPLALRDIPPEDLTAIEGLIQDQEYTEAQAAAQHLARDDGEYGEYCLNAQRDKLAALEPDESR